MWREAGGAERERQPCVAVKGRAAPPLRLRAGAIVT